MVSTLVFYLVVLALSLLRCSADEPKGISKSPQEIIAEHGFICENHTVLTADGYKLSLVRIVNPLVAKRTKLKRPILFSHGLFESATIWLFNSKDVKPRRYPHHVDKVRYGYGPEFERLVLEPKSFADRKSGPFLLANYGYDVWLLSFRGTEYSLRHTNLTVSDPKFWDYSWDDFGLMDTPATLNYIRDLTHANKIGYVGHSQGTFAIFALLADRPHYADLVEPIIAICPVAYLGGLSSPTTRAMFASFGLASYRGQVEHGPFPPMADKMREGSAGACTGATNPFVKTMCKFVEELASGLGQSTDGEMYTQFPYFSSRKVLSQAGQMMLKNRFSKFDYHELNWQKYGSDTCPEYDIGKIRSKSLVLLYTRTDSLTVPRDVERFISELKVEPYRCIYIDAMVNHFDVISSSDADRLVNEPMLEIFEEFESKKNDEYSHNMEGNKVERKYVDQDYLDIPRSLDQIDWQVVNYDRGN